MMNMNFFEKTDTGESVNAFRHYNPFLNKIGNGRKSVWET